MLSSQECCHSSPARAVGCENSFGLRRVHCALMLSMQEDRKLLPDEFSLRAYGGLEELMLDLLRKTAPAPSNRQPESM